MANPTYWRDSAIVQQWKTKDILPNFMLETQMGHMAGSSLSYDANNIALIKDQAGNATIAKGVKSSSAGNLEVHYIEDNAASGALVWTIIGLTDTTSQPNPFGLFDAVRSTNTTVTLANLEIIL